MQYITPDTPDNTRAASFLNVFKNIRLKACPFEIKTIVLLRKEEIRHTRKTSELQKQYGNFKSMLFSLVLLSSLSRVEEDWLKMPPKRKFRESAKTGDEEKVFLGKSVPKSTRYAVTKWSFIIFAQWQNARPNKEAVNEEVEFHVERDKIQSLDTNIVNMTAESLNFWLTTFVEGVCKEDGERNAEFTVCWSVL